MNSNKRDIYFEGRIYKDVDEGPMPSLLFYTSYLVQDSHSFKDGEDVTGAYKLQHQYFGIGHTAVTNEWRDCSENYYDTEFHEDRRIVAIPLPTPAPVAELPKEAEGKAKELVEKFEKAIEKDITATDEGGWDNCNINGIHFTAKQCALICANEIIQSYKDEAAGHLYWDEVRTAINNI